ncbi:alpha/beta hydrolase [Corynebacterium phoceense]|uniref:alpha/beta hydrolase n=1 Tax=Corynebacterium phoceense TaxID=1686286 RepID=UPI00211BB0D6|nr:alpha/beta hydrolase family protein [Corynebacterium phoceense]MCQ9345153.1 esterase family protein [Corynebacterium phoceense]
MKFLRTLTTTSAAVALTLGLATAPLAQADDKMAPNEKAASAASRWGGDFSTVDQSKLSTIKEHDVFSKLEEVGIIKRTDPSDPTSDFERVDPVGNEKQGKIKTFVNSKNEKWRWLLDVNGSNGKVKFMTATSPSMNNREVPLAVITPTGNFDTARPTIYLLNGAGGAEQGMEWLYMTNGKKGKTNLIDFYTSKNVNVVVVEAGAFSYYTDWYNSPHPTDTVEDRTYLPGPQRWETFLTKELPGPLEGEVKREQTSDDNGNITNANINGNGQRAIAGMSMSATSALLLAEHNPGFYNAVGSYSGCAATSTPMTNFYVGLTVNRANNATPEQMWGPRGGEYNRFNDALINSNNLKGTHTYVSASTGLPGEHENLSSIAEKNGGDLSSAFKSSSTLVVEGGAIEAAMFDCTTQLKRKMDREGIDADWNFRATGTHSWPGWKEDIWKSWPTYAAAFGQDASTEVPTATPEASEDRSAAPQAANAETVEKLSPTAEKENEANAAERNTGALNNVTDAAAAAADALTNGTDTAADALTDEATARTDTADDLAATN